MINPLINTILKIIATSCLFFLVNISYAAGNADKHQPLSADKAFQMSFVATSAKEVLVKFKIAPGYYLYRDRMQISLSSKQPITISYPSGVVKLDSDGLKTHVYKDNVTIPVNLEQGESKLLVHYQGCSQQGFCYPPEDKVIHLTPTTALAPLSHANAQDPASIASVHDQQSLLTNHHEIQTILETQNYFFIIPIFLFIGLLLAFTPCVLPMVPILTGIIIGQNNNNESSPHGRSGNKLNTRKAFFLSLTYVLGSALTYALAGVFAASFGKSLQVFLQTPLVIVFVALIFILLALSLFGLFHLRLPSGLHNRMVKMSNAMPSGTYLGTFGMGVLSTLIVSPCVTAPLIGVLLYISQSGNMLLGAIVLFTLGIGMGIPLLLIGTTTGKWLPKSGPWMEGIKKLFGVVMLMMAVWLLSRTMSLEMANILWKISLVVIAFVLGGYAPRLLGRRKFHRSFGLIVGFCGSLLMVGGLSLPNPIVKSATLTQKLEESFKVVHGVTDVNMQIAMAKSLKKPVMLDFYADWCDSCKAMDKNVFTKPRIQQELSHYVMLRADLSANTQQDQALLDYFGVIAPPTVLFFDEKGKEIDNERIVGEVDAGEFLSRIKKEG